jgi:hypothetical protein
MAVPRVDQCRCLLPNLHHHQHVTVGLRLRRNHRLAALAAEHQVLHDEIQVVVAARMVEHDYEKEN